MLSTIFSGQTWGLRWEYHGLFHDSEETPPVVLETCDVLDMYRLLTPSFEKLSAADKKRVKSEADPFEDYVKFQGFDGNNDDHYGVLSYLVQDLKKYEELGGLVLNSHSRGTLPKYRRMLGVFKPMTKDYPRHGLTADQIIQVLKA